MVRIESMTEGNIPPVPTRLSGCPSWRRPLFSVEGTMSTIRSHNMQGRTMYRWACSQTCCNKNSKSKYLTFHSTLSAYVQTRHKHTEQRRGTLLKHISFSLLTCLAHDIGKQVITIVIVIIVDATKVMTSSEQV